jgi:hypothetical protein
MSVCIMVNKLRLSLRLTTYNMRSTFIVLPDIIHSPVIYLNIQRFPDWRYGIALLSGPN